jgi:hypothetical protein
MARADVVYKEASAGSASHCPFTYEVWQDRFDWVISLEGSPYPLTPPDDAGLPTSQGDTEALAFAYARSAEGDGSYLAEWKKQHPPTPFETPRAPRSVGGYPMIHHH